MLWEAKAKQKIHHRLVQLVFCNAFDPAVKPDFRNATHLPLIILVRLLQSWYINCCSVSFSDFDFRPQLCLLMLPKCMHNIYIYTITFTLIINFKKYCKCIYIYLSISIYILSYCTILITYYTYLQVTVQLSLMISLNFWTGTANRSKMPEVIFPSDLVLSVTSIHQHVSMSAYNILFLLYIIF